MITERKIASWETPVTGEADRPNRTASEMKGVFDANSNQLKEAVNGLIDDLAEEGGAENIGVGTIEGLTGTNLWTLLVAFFNKVFGIVKTDQPPNRFLNGAGQYSVPSVGAAANGLPMGGADNTFLTKNGTADYSADWSGADAVRSILNVADGADVTEDAIIGAEAQTEIADTDVLPVAGLTLKKISWANIKAALATVFAKPGLRVTGLALPVSGYTSNVVDVTVSGMKTTKDYILVPDFSDDATTNTAEHRAWNLMTNYKTPADNTLRITVKAIPVTSVAFMVKEVV